MCGGCAALGARQRWQLAVRMALLVVSDGGSRFCILPRRDLLACQELSNHAAPAGGRWHLFALAGLWVPRPPSAAS
jgi:hypothetical protein